MSQLILYDLPSKGRCFCWSLNPWKSRLALNYKGINYKTTWVEYPDIQATLSPHVEPNSDGKFTIPAMQFPDGTYVMDSEAIAARLEAEHPSPSLHLDSPLLPEVYALIPAILGPLRPEWLPRVPVNLLNDVSSEFFHRTREAELKKSLARYKEEEGGEECWMEALPAIKELGEVLKRNEGPFVMGKTVSYADFVIVGFLHCLKVIEEDLYQRVVKVEPALKDLYEASKPWLERDGH